MPHRPEPFYRAPRRLWYVQIGAKQINLGRDEKEAWRRYYEIMAARDDTPPAPAADSGLALVVVDQFLGWVERHKAPRTFEWYRRHCEAFARSVPRDLTVARLKPLHLTRLCDSHADWSDTTKHGFCRAVQRAFRWAERQGMIDKSPLGMVEKPEPRDRDVVITPDEYRKVLGLVKGGFRDLLAFSWESGIRPQEIRLVEARHLDLARGRVVFPPKEAKGKKLPRVIYLPDAALALARALAERHPEGPLFRNADGAGWTRFAVNCAFIRLGKKIGRKLHLGAFRKSFATEALKNGVDPVTASHLLGHSNTNMLAKVYARLGQDPEYLRGQARKATGEGS